VSEPKDYREKNWDEKFEQWKHKRENEKSKSEDGAHPLALNSFGREIKESVERIEKSAEKTVEEVEEEIKEVEKGIKEYEKSRPRHVKVFRFLAVLIPVLIVLYLISANFLVAQDFEYTYNLGESGENYLTPAERVSQSASDNGVSYKNLTGGLVYFDVPIARGAENVNVEVKFKDNFPENAKLSLGARDQEEWHYLYKGLYNPLIDLGSYEHKGRVYRLNDNLPLVDEVGLENLDGVTIASEDFTPTMNKVDDYENSEIEINVTLRGKHVFYIYASQELEVEVEKRDINWYEGSDELFIMLYDSDGVLVEMTQIGDDGVVDASKALGKKQKIVLKASGLNEGVYRLELSDFDGLVTNLKINSNKVVAEKVFLADNEIYGAETKESKLYFDYTKNVTLKLTTYHKEGLQKILFNHGGNVEGFSFDVEDAAVYKKVAEGNYEVTFTKNDIVIESPEYFAFTPSGYFRPFRQKVVSVSSPEWVMDSADYLITDYAVPQKEGDWIIASTDFDIAKENLFVTEKGILSFVFNTPHLAEAGSNYTIPVDWIKIKVHKPGVFG